MHRTRPSPICCATSATTVIFSPSSTRSISTAKLISGNECGGNSASTTGPAMATTRPSFNPSAGVAVGAAVVVMLLFLLWTLAERFCAPHDLHDLGRDRVLAGPVHDACKG